MLKAAFLKAFELAVREIDHIPFQQTTTGPLPDHDWPRFEITF
jgi:hypothetical protein